MALKRGDIVTAVFGGSYGKPRPALVVQADHLSEALRSIILCPMTSSHVPHLDALRVSVMPNNLNGLQETTYIMADKIITVPREKVGKSIGHVDHQAMEHVEMILRFALGL